MTFCQYTCAGIRYRGWHAIELSSGMRRHGPALATTLRLGLAADVILLSAVWQHLAPTDRPRAFRKLVTLLTSGGLLAITLRHGPAEPERSMHPVSRAEFE